MAMSAWQKQREANRKNDARLAAAAAAGKTINTSRPNPNKPNPIHQAGDVRANLAQRYKNVGEGKGAGLGTSGTRNIKNGLITSNSKGAIYKPTVTEKSAIVHGSGPGVRSSVLSSIGTVQRPATSAPRMPQTRYANTRDQDAAIRKVAGPTPDRVANSTTTFQEGLRDRLKKRG